MKTCILTAAFALTAMAQSPLPPKVPDDKVVAKVDGKDVTAGEVYAALLAMPPQFVQLYNTNQKYAVQQLFMMRFLSSEAEKYKLSEASPYKEQLQALRDNILATALLGYQQDHFPVSEESIQKYYDDHLKTYEQSKVRVISVRFKPVSDPKASFEDRARADLEAALGNITRSEEEAKARAAEVAAKLKSGGDFEKLVAEYSDDVASKAKGGDFGLVSGNSQHPDEIKRIVAAGKEGETSAPVRVSNAYMIVRVDEKKILPKHEVEVYIMQDLRKVQLKAWFDDVTHRFDPVLVAPEFFTQPAPVPSMGPSVALPGR